MTYPERLMYVTRNLVQYGGYGKDPVKAARVVRKYFKDKSLEVCKASLDQYVRAYEEGIEFVETNQADYWKETRPDGLIAREKVFCKRHSGIPPWLVIQMLAGVFNWYHER